MDCEYQVPIFKKWLFYIGENSAQVKLFEVEPNLRKVRKLPLQKFPFNFSDIFRVVLL